MQYAAILTLTNPFNSNKNQFVEASATKSKTHMQFQ